MSLYHYLRGLWRLRFGFCLECNSSPPRLECGVCHGERSYGHRAAPSLRRAWRDTWAAQRAGQTGGEVNG